MLIFFLLSYLSSSYFLACLLLTFLLVFFLLSCLSFSYFLACLLLTFLLVFFLLSCLSSSYFLACLLLTFLLAFFLLSCSPYLLAGSLWAPTADHILRQTCVKMQKTHIKTHRIEMNTLVNHFISSLWEQLQKILNMKITWHIIIWFVLRLEVRLIIWWMKYHLMIQQSISELECALKSHLNAL